MFYNQRGPHMARDGKTPDDFFYLEYVVHPLKLEQEN